jgi:hypothetical protein
MEPKHTILGFSINRILSGELKPPGKRINGSGGSHLFIEIYNKAERLQRSHL